MKKMPRISMILIFAVLMTTLLMGIAFALSSCAPAVEDQEYSKHNEKSPALQFVDPKGNQAFTFYVAIDPETGVNYLWNTSNGSVVPRYNADGTIMVTSPIPENRRE